MDADRRLPRRSGQAEEGARTSPFYDSTRCNDEAHPVPRRAVVPSTDLPYQVELHVGEVELFVLVIKVYGNGIFDVGYGKQHISPVRGVHRYCVEIVAVGENQQRGRHCNF